MYNHSIEWDCNDILKDSSNQHNDGDNQETFTKLQRYQKSKNEIITKLDNNPDLQPHELEKWMLAKLPVYLHLKIESMRKIKYNFKKANPNMLMFIII